MKQEISVLVIEPDRGFIFQLNKTLSVDNHFSEKVVSAKTLLEGLAELSHSSFDLIFLNLFLSDSQGLSTFHQVHAQAPLTPIVVLTELVHVAVAVESLKSGAEDYLLKEETDSVHILRTVQRVTEHQHILADKKTVMDKAFLQATRDPLTGLPNRALFHDRFKMSLVESKRQGETMGLVFLDLDNFKEINDQLGHDVGDKILISIGKCLSQNLRSEDSIARVGGDEFLFLLRHLQSIEAAQILFRRLQNELGRPFPVSEQMVSVRASMGISLYPFDGEEAERLLKCADTAMYRAKRKGGHCFEFFNKPQMPFLFNGVKRQKIQQNILVIDDDADYQQILQKILEREGYACMNCLSVEDALQQIKFNPPDLVILDLGFRQASGIAFLQNIAQAMGEDQEVPAVLIVSGYSDREIVEFTTRLGASCFLPKPASAAQIVSAIRSCLH